MVRVLQKISFYYQQLEKKMQKWVSNPFKGLYSTLNGVLRWKKCT